MLAGQGIRRSLTRAPVAADGGAGRRRILYLLGRVSEDSDGPIEWCRPVPAGEAKTLAEQLPELELRSEPVHREAAVHLGPGNQITPYQ